MLLALRHLERAFIKFLWLAVSHVLWCDGNPTMEIFFIDLQAGKLPLLSRFGYKYSFKSICPNYFCIQELLRTYVGPANSLTHSCLFKSLSEDNFLILVSFPKLFKFSLLSFLCVFLPSPFFQLLLAFLSFSWGWVDLRVW